MGAKVTNGKEAYCASEDGIEVFMLTKVDDEFNWNKKGDADFLVKYPEYPALGAKKAEKPVKTEEKKEDPEEVAAPKIDHGKIVALYKAGWPVPKIADEIGCTSPTVRNHIEKAKKDGEVKG